ncbi:alanine racemase [Flavobacteriaceae bacterium]|nr:alanine racemase [Flavobacteriaceae bacterium]
MQSPRIEISLDKIAKNAQFLKNHYGSKGITIIGVTKAVCGNPEIAQVLVKSGITILADSRMTNIIKMRSAGINAQFLLLRTPLRSELKEVVKYADISHNTELSIITELSTIAISQGVIHKIILMVELGDLREGILPSNLNDIITKIKQLKGVDLVGIGTNLACFGGVIPDDKNMASLSDLIEDIEKELNLNFTFVSGGNSANYNWFQATKNVRRISHLRIGESIFLGVEPVYGKQIPGLFKDAFTLVAEIIESNTKPSIPSGSVGRDAFGKIPIFTDQGQINRVIVGLGQQDVAVTGLTPRLPIEVLGASSDHLIINSKQSKLEVGTTLKFDMNYAALVSSMTSPYVTKTNVNTMTALEYCVHVEQNDFNLKSQNPLTPIIENGSPLVSLKDYEFDLMYEPSINKDYKYLVREEIVEKIGRISKALENQNKKLIIRSVWRSFSHQRLIWENQHAFLVKKHPEKSKVEIDELVSHFIAPSEKSMHSTGGAVDGLIYDLKNDCVMDFGTNEGLNINLNEKCFPYHPDISKRAKENRKLLINLFESEGFVCDTKEYWHFDYGNAIWATKKNKQHAIYDVIKMT